MIETAMSNAVHLPKRRRARDPDYGEAKCEDHCISRTLLMPVVGCAETEQLATNIRATFDNQLGAKVLSSITRSREVRCQEH